MERSSDNKQAGVSPHQTLRRRAQFALNLNRVSQHRARASTDELSANDTHLEKAVSWFRLVTQNVDGLHHEAGSSQVVELHGSIWKVRCTTDGRIEEDHRLTMEELPPRCECRSIVRPHIIWFGETLRSEDLEQAFEATRQAELFLVVGTSGIVQPAASLAGMARRQGAYVVEINPEETPLTPWAQESHRGAAAEILPALLSGADLP